MSLSVEIKLLHNLIEETDIHFHNKVIHFTEEKGCNYPMAGNYSMAFGEILRYDVLREIRGATYNSSVIAQCSAVRSAL